MHWLSMGRIPRAKLRENYQKAKLYQSHWLGYNIGRLTVLGATLLTPAGIQIQLISQYSKRLRAGSTL